MPPLVSKWLVGGFIVLIILSLALALWFLVYDRQKGAQRLVRTLTGRIFLSCALLIILMTGFFQGWWCAHPSSLQPVHQNEEH